MAETGPAPPTARHSVGLSSTGVFAVALAIQLLGYIPTHFFAQHVGASPGGRDVLGTFQLFLLIASSINMIGDLRIGSAYTFYVARGEPATVGTATYFFLRLALVAVAGVVVWVSGPALGYAPLQLGFLFALWLVLPLLWSVSTVYSQQWAAQGQSIRGQVPILVESVARTGALTVVALWSLALPAGSFSDVLGPITYAYVFGAAVSAAYSFASVRRVTTRYSGEVARRYVRYAWPLMASLMLLYLASTLPQFFVAGHYGPGEYNIFLAPNGLRILLLSIPGAVAVPLFPHLSGLHKRRNYEMIRQRTWAAIRYSAIVTVPLIATMVVYRVNVLNDLYQTDYANQGAFPLVLLAISGLPAVLAQIIGTSLNSVGLQRLELYLTSLQVALLLGVMTLLMPPIGWLGLSGSVAASAAILVSSTAALGLNAYFMLTLLGVRIQLRSAGTIVAAAGLSFFVVRSFNQYIDVNGIALLVVGGSLSVAVYALVLAAVGELSKADVHLIVGALGLPNRVASSLSRLCWRAESWPVNPLPPGGAAGLKPLDPTLESESEGEGEPLEPPS